MVVQKSVPAPIKDNYPRCTDCLNRIWREKLCYSHWKEDNGFVFDDEKKIYVRKKGK